MMKPRALLLLARGTNRDQDAAEALRLVGAEPEIIALNTLREGRRNFRDAQILVLPGGFSYADALGAGKLLAIDLQAYFSEQMHEFVEAGKPVIGICNGFQTLVKSGILPGINGNGTRSTTLTFNANGRFECRWIAMKPSSQACLWTKGLEEVIMCPIAHGEGNFQAIDATLTTRMQVQDQVALVYVHPDGVRAEGTYPVNPNGSMLDIAGICNPRGNVLGLMPHPENYIHAWQHPLRTRGGEGQSGLALFQNGVKFAREL